MDVSNFSARKLSSLPQKHLLWHALRELFVSGHFALKNGSEINFISLKRIGY